MVASDTGTLALTASSCSISAVTCRSPLPKSIQPSAMRCRVGRKPTPRSMALTSCQGHPVREYRELELATAPECRSAAVKTTLWGGGMDYPERCQAGGGTIVAFVTYCSEDAQEVSADASFSRRRSQNRWRLRALPLRAP